MLSCASFSLSAKWGLGAAGFDALGEQGFMFSVVLFHVDSEYLGRGSG